MHYTFVGATPSKNTKVYLPASFNEVLIRVANITNNLPDRATSGVMPIDGLIPAGGGSTVYCFGGYLTSHAFMGALVDMNQEYVQLVDFWVEAGQVAKPFLSVWTR